MKSIYIYHYTNIYKNAGFPELVTTKFKKILKQIKNDLENGKIELVTGKSGSYKDLYKQIKFLKSYEAVNFLIDNLDYCYIAVWEE